MKKMRFILILIISALFVLAYAQEKDELIYSHKFHIEEAEVSCSDCHKSVLTSQQASDNLLPPMETCYNCHDEDDTECTFCHTNPDEAIESPRSVGLKANFAHQVHAKSDQDCANCHGGIVSEEQADGLNHIPGRNECADCHGLADFSEEKFLCIQCHNVDMNFVPDDHNALWNKNHGVVAQIEEAACVHCHQTNYCISCHEGDNLDRLAHPLNFRNNHALAAKGNKDNCVTCHQEQAFCIECHQTELVMPRNHSFANWSNTSNGGRHAREAEFDFDSCQSCHNGQAADLVCIECHQK